MVLVSTVDAPGRAPIVVQDPVKAEINEDELKQTTLIIDKVQPGHDVFADQKGKKIESKEPVEPLRPEEEPKEISSFFQTEIQGMHIEKQPESVLLPDANAATTWSSDPPAVPATSSSSTSASVLNYSSSGSIMSSIGEQSSASSTELVATSTIVTQPEVAVQRAGPLDHADAEADRVRKELFPDVAGKW